MNIYSDRENLIIEAKIKPNLKLIYDMKIRGLSDKYIAKALGISLKEFLRVKETYELLNDTYNDAMEILASELTDIVVGRALGKDGRKDKDGNPLPADEKLAFKVLEKIDSRFSTKQEVKQTVTIESFIRSIAKKQQEIIEMEDIEEDDNN